MPLKLAETMHRQMVEESEDEANTLEKPVRRSFLARVFRRKRTKAAFTAEVSQSRRDRRSDAVVAALGVTLGLICALFPWYIFYNPEQFGVRAIKLGTGEFSPTGPMPVGRQSVRVGAPIAVDPSEVEPLQLDLFATGTTQDGTGKQGATALSAQPFPAAPTPFKLVHVANGRAMIEDDSGLFIVQRGSSLPDRSVVRSIEQRAGQWVIVTSTDEVLRLSE